MRIVVTSQGPDMTSEVDPRFARAAYFMEVDTDTGDFTAHDNEQSMNAAQGAGVQAAQNVVALDVDAVVTGNVGPKAFAALEAVDVKVYVGAKGTVADAVEKLKSSGLELADGANVEGHWV